MLSTTRLPAPRRIAAILVVIASGTAGLVAAHRAAEVAAVEVDPAEAAWDPFAVSEATPVLTSDCTTVSSSGAIRVHAWVAPDAPLRAGVWTFEVTAGDMIRTVTLALDRDRRGFGWRCVECEVDGPLGVHVALPWHGYRFANGLPPWSGYAFGIHVTSRDDMAPPAPTIDITVRHRGELVRRSFTARYLRRAPGGPACGSQSVQRELMRLALGR
jgi:hypothetical protein